MTLARRQDQQLAGLVANYDQRHAQMVVTKKIKQEAIHTQAELTDYAMGAVTALAQRQQLYTALAPHAAGLLNHMFVTGALEIDRLKYLGGDW